MSATDQAVGLHRLEDPAQWRSEAGDVRGRFQAQARPHRQGSGGRARLVRSREDIAVRGADGDAEGMADRPGCVSFVVAHQPGENREAGGVGARPAVRPAEIAVEGPDGARAGGPALTVPVQVVELEEEAVIAIDQQQVAVAARVGGTGVAAFDPLRLGLGLLGDGISGRAAGRAGIALVRIVEIDRDERLAARHRGVRQSVDLGLVTAVAAEVGVHPPVRADELDESGARRVDRRLRDVDVPPVVGRQERQRSGQRAALGRALRERSGGEGERQRQRPGGERGAAAFRERHSSSPGCRPRSRR